MVVVEKEVHKEEYRKLEWRLIRVSSGFGMRQFAHGIGLQVKYIKDNEECRRNGDEISLSETMKFQQKYGKFGELLEDPSLVEI